MVSELELASMLKALGDPTRLRIYTFLRTCAAAACCCEECACSTYLDDKGALCCCCGRSVGEVCCEVMGTDKISSSLSFHLKELRTAGLIKMEKQGQRVICTISPEAVATLDGFFSVAAQPLVKEEKA